MSPWVCRVFLIGRTRHGSFLNGGVERGRKTVLVYFVGRPRVSSAGVAAPSLSDLPDWDWYYISAHLLAQNAILLAVRPNSASFGDSGAAFARQNDLTFVFRRKLFTHV